VALLCEFGALKGDNMQKYMTCGNCGSRNIAIDAFASWNISAQCWELSGLLDNTECDDCGEPTRLIECDLETGLPIS
jgi:hypothetical protein